MKTIKILIIQLTLLFLTVSYAQNPVANFIGTDGNWFEPSNWDTGTVPGPSDAAVIPTGTPPIFINNATVDVGSIDVDDTAFNLSNGVVHVFGWGFARSFRKFNPSYVESQVMTMVGDEGHTVFSLGGLQPASDANQGPGFYANVHTQDMQMAGSLEIQFMYGFEPQVGDSFQIITIDGTQTGSFFGAVEGSVVASLNGVNLVISYQAGDGNDVVLTAVNAVQGTNIAVIPTLNFTMLFTLIMIIISVVLIEQRTARLIFPKS